MKISAIHRLLALTLMLIVIAPIAVQTAHAFEKHEHTICNAVDVKHIHNQDIDCSVFHFQIQHDTFDFHANYEEFCFQQPLENQGHYAASLYHIYLISKSSRAPPCPIVSYS